jgi:hypothetical protein
LLNQGAIKNFAQVAKPERGDDLLTKLYERVEQLEAELKALRAEREPDNGS